jgi:transposase
LLKSCGHEVIVANAQEVSKLCRRGSKTDRMDAEQLARLARSDPKLLRPIQHRSEQSQADLAVLRARDVLVAARTRLVNHVRGTLKSFAIRAKRCSTRSFEKQVLASIPKSLEPALLPVLEELTSLSERIAQYDKRIKRLCEEPYGETALPMQVKGVGPLTALAFVLTLEDPRRFKRSRSVGAYLGLRPKKRQSGDQDPELGITKCGDRFLRRLLVGSAQYILGPFGADSDLRRWGLLLAGRGGKNAKKRAVVAVARKLATLLHRLWISGEIYEPLRAPARTRRAS